VAILSDPFDALIQLQQALDTYRTSSWLGSSLSSGGAYPPLNVFRIVVIIEVPGVRKADLQIQVKGNTIRLAGAKSVQYGDSAALHRRERQSGSFDRAITVPVEIDVDQVTAECHDGMLTLFLPRAERDKPKLITVG